MVYKLGSLFDGSGGFPLSGALCGIEPRWAAEVEPYPIAVTRSRFPNMKHLGDISKVNGAEIEPVDIITFGSPCQDLSVAGKRAGLKHEANGDEETTRSGLFMEAVRIIKEMRIATNGEYPRFALWENVPGAFSSNKGEDFRIVCEELIKVVEPTASMPSVPKSGWPYADSYVGDGWSLAYRVFDAQYWGVPQRRRRIHLIADFRGERAREVLFEREGVQGYFETGRTPWQAAPADAEGRPGADDREGESSNGAGDGRLDAVVDQGEARANELVVEARPIPMGLGIQSSNGIGAFGENVMPCLINGDNPGWQNGVLAPVGFDSYNLCTTGNVGRTVTTPSGGLNEHIPTVIEPKDPVIAFDRAAFNQGQNAKYDFEITDSGVNSTLIARGPSGVAFCVADHPTPKVDEKGKTFTLNARDYKAPLVAAYPAPVRYIVRRLTPTECARLQGFADWWGFVEKKNTFTEDELRFWLEVRNTHAAINGKKVQDYTEKQMLTWYNKLYTDSAEYKMWGNGIALPPALYCMQGIVDALNAEEDLDEWML